MPKGVRTAKAVAMHASRTTLVPPGSKVLPGTNEPLPNGVSVRSNRAVQISFMLDGRRCTETIAGKPTIDFVLLASEKRERVIRLISLDKFVYEDEFPHSPRVRKAKDELRRASRVITVGEALNEWFALKRREPSPNTYDDYQSAIEHQLKPAKLPPAFISEHGLPSGVTSLGGLPVDRLTDTLISAIRNRLHESRTAKRVNNILIPLRQSLGRLKKQGVIERNPFDALPPLTDASASELAVDETVVALDEPLPIEAVAKLSREDRAPDPFTPEECAAILAHLKGPMVNYFAFAFWTGLRTGELLALRWGDIDLGGRRMLVRRSLSRGNLKKTKTNRQRWVDLLPPAVAALKAQFPLSGQKQAWVFPNPFTGEGFKNESKVVKRWKRALTSAGVRYRRPYQCRHTYASTLLSAGENQLFVAQQMRHENWSMIVQVYGHWIPEVDRSLGQRVRLAHEDAWTRLQARIEAATSEEQTEDDLGEDEELDDDEDEFEADCNGTIEADHCDNRATTEQECPEAQ